MKIKNKFINIAGRKVGLDHKPLVVPEIGVNHGGSIEIAFKIVDAAKKAGAEIIKTQTIIPNEDMSNESKKIKINILKKKNIFDLLEKLSFSEEQEYKLKNYIEKKKMIYMSTPFSKAGVDRLIKFGIKVFKIGSGELSNFLLVDYIAKFKKPMIISTGMHNLQSILNITKRISKINKNFALLHCTSIYPTPNNLVRLNSILQLRNQFNKNVIGLSDHTDNFYSSLAAVALGAAIIEKHFVDTKKRIGPDIDSSIDQKDLEKLIQGCNIIYEQTHGNRDKILKKEKLVQKFAFSSVTTTKNIFKGEKFSLKNIYLKRPGNGELKIDDYTKILGKKSRVYIKQNTQVKKKWIIN